MADRTIDIITGTSEASSMGTNDTFLVISGSTLKKIKKSNAGIGSGSGSGSVTVSADYTSGTRIATINGTAIYVPNGNGVQY